MGGAVSPIVPKYSDTYLGKQWWSSYYHKNSNRLNNINNQIIQSASYWINSCIVVGIAQSKVLFQIWWFKFPSLLFPTLTCRFWTFVSTLCYTFISIYHISCSARSLFPLHYVFTAGCSRCSIQSVEIFKICSGIILDRKFNAADQYLWDQLDRKMET